MASYIPPTQLATADDLDVVSWNAVAGDVQFLYQKPYILAYGSVGITIIPTFQNQITPLTVQASNYGFSLSGSNIIVPLAGVYSVAFSVGATSGAGSDPNYFQASVTHQGTLTLFGNQVGCNSEFPTSGGAGLIVCSANDSMGLFVFQDSGSNLTSYTGPAGTYLHVSFVGSQ